MYRTLVLVLLSALVANCAIITTIRTQNSLRAHQWKRDWEMTALNAGPLVITGVDVWHFETLKYIVRWDTANLENWAEAVNVYMEHSGVEHVPHPSYEDVPETLGVHFQNLNSGKDRQVIERWLTRMKRLAIPCNWLNGVDDAFEFEFVCECANPTTTVEILSFLRQEI
jgi:hypothetical protein